MSNNNENRINDLLHRLDRIKQEDEHPRSQNMQNTCNNVLQLNRPRQLGLSSPGMRRPQELRFSPRRNDNSEIDNKLREIMKISGKLTINNQIYQTDIKDMEHIEVLGNGTCGSVMKMRHSPSNSIIAVKQMRRSGNSEENKRIIMDIEVVLKSHDCPFIVQCLGCFITESEVWICMELMSTCFDKLLKRLQKPIPEPVLGKVTVATVEALSYLKDKHGVIHRDVKPSNILIDTKGSIKLCDFGISGRLVDSLAKTRNAGCAAYMAPERIEPDPDNPDYDVRADVWSLGITLVELATGQFPYTNCETDFEMLTLVVYKDPPSLPEDKDFTPEFRDFVKYCLIKEKKDRPKYNELKHHRFIKKYETAQVDVGGWFVSAVDQADVTAARDIGIDEAKAGPRQTTPSAIKRFFLPNSKPTQDSPPIAQYSPNLTNGTHQPAVKPDTQLDNSSNESFLHPAKTVDRKVNHISLLSTFQKNNNSSNHQRDNLAVCPHQRPPDTCSRQSTCETDPPLRSYSPYQAYQNHLTATKLTDDLDTYKPVRYDKHFHSPMPQRRNTQADGVTSPYQHRRVQSENRWRSPSASPLPLRSEFQTDEVLYNSGNTSPIILQRFYHQQKQQKLAKEAEETGKKRFASYIKLQLSGDRSGRSSRHQSPEPPPRLNRGASGDNQSPLALRRHFLDANQSTSPSLSRRYVSPTPPVPPPRKLSESNSVPGSPQHFRARFHYTPEPQRRQFHNTDVS